MLRSTIQYVVTLLDKGKILRRNALMAAADFKWLYMAGGVLFSSLAQICLKQATLLEDKQLQWFFYITESIFFYFFSFVAYYMALQYFAISKVAPVMTIGVVLLVVLYGIWIGETMNWKNMLGLLSGSVSLALLLS